MSETLDTQLSEMSPYERLEWARDQLSQDARELFRLAERVRRALTVVHGQAKGEPFEARFWEMAVYNDLVAKKLAAALEKVAEPDSEVGEQLTDEDRWLLGLGN